MYSRAYGYVQRRWISFVGGVTLDEIKQNSSSQFAAAVKIAAEQAEAENPNITKVRVKDSVSHRSQTDPNDPQPVISVTYLTEQEKKVYSAHIHEDGSSKSK